MRIAYGDLIGGISGDMFVGAMLDLGLSLPTLRRSSRKSPRFDTRSQSQKKPFTASAQLNFR